MLSDMTRSYVDRRHYGYACKRQLLLVQETEIESSNALFLLAEFELASATYSGFCFRVRFEVLHWNLTASGE